MYIDVIDESNAATSVNTIGITGFHYGYLRDLASIKSSLLYFDDIYLFDLFQILRGEDLDDIARALGISKERLLISFNELTALIEHGLIKLIDVTKIPVGYYVHTNETAGALYSIFMDAGEKNTALIEEYSVGNNVEPKFEGMMIDRMRVPLDAGIRITSDFLNVYLKHNYVPILSTDFSRFQQLKSHNDRKIQVLNIVLNKIPMIEGKLAIPQLKEFKDDPDTRLKLARLRDWLLEICRKDYSEKEIEQKLEYLLQEYTQQFNFHKIKHVHSMAECTIMPILEIAENLVKLQFSKVGKTLFSLSKANLELTEQEQKFTGKEIAFIHKARNTDFT